MFRLAKKKFNTSLAGNEWIISFPKCFSRISPMWCIVHRISNKKPASPLKRQAAGKRHKNVKQSSVSNGIERTHRVCSRKFDDIFGRPCRPYWKRPNFRYHKSFSSIGHSFCVWCINMPGLNNKVSAWKYRKKWIKWKINVAKTVKYRPNSRRTSITME